MESITFIVVLIAFGSVSFLISVGILVAVRRESTTLEASVQVEKSVRQFVFLNIFLLVSAYALFYVHYFAIVGFYPLLLSGYLLFLGLFCFGFCLQAVHLTSKSKNIYMLIMNILLRCTVFLSLICIYQGAFMLILYIFPFLNASIVAFSIVFIEIALVFFTFFFLLKNGLKKRDELA